MSIVSRDMEYEYSNVIKIRLNFSIQKIINIIDCVKKNNYENLYDKRADFTNCQIGKIHTLF